MTIEKDAEAIKLGWHLQDLIGAAEEASGARPSVPGDALARAHMLMAIETYWCIGRSRDQLRAIFDDLLELDGPRLAAVLAVTGPRP